MQLQVINLGVHMRWIHILTHRKNLASTGNTFRNISNLILSKKGFFFRSKAPGSMKTRAEIYTGPVHGTDLFAYLTD